MSKTMHKFSPEVRQHAGRLVLDHEHDHSSRWAAILSIASKIGCTGQTLNEWVKKAEVDAGKRAGVPIAPSTYRDHVAKRADPAKLSAREKRDLELNPAIERGFAENFAVYGVRKVWRRMLREGFAVARCTGERLMADFGLPGVIRGNRSAPRSILLVGFSSRWEFRIDSQWKSTA